MGFKFLRGVALFRVRPLGGLPSLTWPLEILALGTLIKTVFVRGGSPPIWGRYGVWPVCTLAHFFSKSASQILDYFCQSQVRPAYYRSWKFKQNRNSTIRANLAQIWKKTRYLTFSRFWTSLACHISAVTKAAQVQLWRTIASWGF